MAQEEAEEQVAEGTEGDKPAKKGKKKLIIIAGGLVVLLLLAVGVPLMMLSGGEKVEEVYNPEDFYVTAPLGEFVVNLSASNSFLKIKVLLEYDSKTLARLTGGSAHSGTDLPAVFKAREPMIKDSVIKVMSSKKAQEVLSAEGKTELKYELIYAINDILALNEDVVVGMYFTDFLIQG